jgi:radical SAM protein with 4Fe4S-binding SPASM domain
VPLNEATKRNLRRKSAYVDMVQLHDDKPLPSWIDLSLTELCNRSAGHPGACSFCPRIDPTFYPNQNVHMSLALVGKIAQELKILNYTGVVVLCGYGEPMLHPNVVDVVLTLKDSGCRVEIVTNGDFLGPNKIKQLRAAGLDYFVVSMYDGPEQVAKFTQQFSDAGCNAEHYLLRDRWHSEADQFGLKLTNRGGVVTVGPQDAVDTHRPCYYTAYQMQVDWNGDVLLCPQDWHKKLKFGNLFANSILEIWNSKRLHARRLRLMSGRRDEHPCSECNTDGTLHGANHVSAWRK